MGGLSCPQKGLVGHVIRVLRLVRTNSSLSIDTEMNDVSDKDTSVYGTQEPGRITWTVTTDHTLDQDEYLKFVEWNKDQSKKKIWYGLRSGYKGSASFDPDSEVNDGA